MNNTGMQSLTQQTIDLRSVTAEELQQKLVEKIVNDRIYKDEQLQELFDNAIALNSHLGEQQLSAIVARIKRDLDEA